MKEQTILLSDVIKFVVDAHYGQFRKGSGLPYIVHPFDVLKRVSDWGIKDEIVCRAALAHDVLEERQDISFEHLAVCIGHEAASIVEELTFIPNKNLTTPVSVQKNQYLDSIGNASIQALVIKMADRIANTMDFHHDQSDYAEKYWHKADGLFKTFFSKEKQEEITRMFGSQVCQAIKNDYMRTAEIVQN
jgi:(p)ppGpp synthase/HD superfamily hydrolase